MVPYMITQLAAYPDLEDNLYFINVTTGGYGITVDESCGSMLYVCALLNSRLLDFYLKQVSTHFSGGYFAANKQYMEQLPIRTIDFADSRDRQRHDELVDLVQRIMELQRQRDTARTPHDRHAVQSVIDGVDRQIQLTVNGLYQVESADALILEEQAI
jgi:hypothetical protein